jgi:hypothetical protein
MKTTWYLGDIDAYAALSLFPSIPQAFVAAYAERDDSRCHCGLVE